MEQFLDGSSNTTDNNNVIDNLEILKENQLNAMETDKNIETLLLKNDNAATKLSNENLNDANFENLIENKESEESKDLIKDLINEIDHSNDSEKIEETFFEKQSEPISKNALIDNLLEDSLSKETTNQNDNTLNKVEFSNLIEINETKQENQITDNTDFKFCEDNLANKSINLSEQLSKQINLIETSDEALINDQSIDKKEVKDQQKSSLDQIIDQPEFNGEKLLVSSLNNDENVKKEKNELLDDLNEEINKKNTEEFSQDIKTEKANLDQSALRNEKSEEETKLTLEDFVRKDKEIRNESSNENLIKEETLMVEKSNECKSPSYDENSCQLQNSSEVITTFSKEEIEVVQNVRNEKLDESKDHITSKSKVDDIFTQSQELLKQADKLIAEKRNSINEINIPGLDVKINSESIAEEQATDDLKKPESNIEKPVDKSTTDEKKPQISDENNTSKTSVKQNSSKKCIIS